MKPGLEDARRAAFAMSPGLRAFPVVNGSADFSLAVRDAILAGNHDCIAVPLPPTMQAAVEAAVDALPVVHAVVQACGDDPQHASYVPIDPCQPVIRALAIAAQERIPRAFVDLDVPNWRADAMTYPDPYALKVLSAEAFATAVLSVSPAPVPGSLRDRRIRHQAFTLHKLELEHERILFLPDVVDWPWIRDAYVRRLPYPAEEPWFAPIETWPVRRDTLSFFLAELPYVTHLYHRRRFELHDDASLTIDGIKELILEARDRLIVKRASFKKRLSIQSLKLYLRYVRNLTLIHCRLRPDLVTLVEGAKQVLGDDFAISLVETAKHYPEQPDAGESLRMGIHRADIPSLGTVWMESRLPGHAMAWREIDLRPQPEPRKTVDWRQAWNPFTQCSWPPEDARIESFNLHVREQARNLISSDLARTEKFTSSLKDGLDIRETLRNWHTGDLWVRELPPAKGDIEVVVFLFEVPADPADFPWRTTWFAENKHESTLCFFATNFLDDMVGPGIAQARYGGAFFLFPPRPLPDVWTDPGLRDCDTLEERLLGGAFLHSRDRWVAVVSPCPIKPSWRRLARRFGKQIVHLPLRRFSGDTVERLRSFHVLNGKEVRSYAADFVRRPD